MAVAIAAPLALIAATWEPLEPPPRSPRANVDERVSAPGTAVANPPAGDDQSRERKATKEAAPTYAIPTSVPGVPTPSP